MLIGTVVEDSPIPINKCIVVLWLECNAKNSISSYEIQRAMSVAKKSACLMLHRARQRCKTLARRLIGVPITEVDRRAAEWEKPGSR